MGRRSNSWLPKSQHISERSDILCSVCHIEILIADSFTPEESSNIFKRNACRFCWLLWWVFFPKSVAGPKIPGQGKPMVVCHYLLSHGYDVVRTWPTVKHGLRILCLSTGNRIGDPLITRKRALPFTHSKEEKILHISALEIVLLRYTNSFRWCRCIRWSIFLNFHFESEYYMKRLNVWAIDGRKLSIDEYHISRQEKKEGECRGVSDIYPHSSVILGTPH